MASDYKVTQQELDMLTHELEAARERLGSLQSKLSWIFEFADKDLKKLPPSELSIASYNLLGITPLDRTGWPTQAPVKPMDVKMLRKIQQQMRDVLDTLFCLKVPAESRHETAEWKVWGPDWVGIKRLSPLDAKETILELYHRTNRRDHYVLHAFLTALAQGTKFIHTCKRCSKPFVATTKRAEYCGLDCAQRYRNEKKKSAKAAKMKPK